MTHNKIVSMKTEKSNFVEKKSVMDDDAAGKIASIGSVSAGVLFACGWYLFFGMVIDAHLNCLIWDGYVVNCTDANQSHPYHGDIAPDALVNGAYWGPGIMSTFGLIGLNIISWEAFETSLDDISGRFVRVWTMISLVMLFSGLGFAIFCLITDLQTVNAWHTGGVVVFLQNMLILLAAFIFRAVRRSGDHSI